MCPVSNHRQPPGMAHLNRSATKMKNAIRQFCLLAASGLGAVWVFIDTMSFGDALKSSYDPWALVETCAFFGPLENAAKVFAVAVVLRALAAWRFTYWLFLLAAGALIANHYSTSSWGEYFHECAWGVMMFLGFVLTGVFISDFRRLRKDRPNQTAHPTTL